MPGVIEDEEVQACVVSGDNESAPADSTVSRAGRAAAGDAAAAMVQRGITAPAEYAEFLRQHPALQQQTLAYLHRRFGNKFVVAVLDALDRAPSPVPTSEGARGAAGHPGPSPAANDRQTPSTRDAWPKERTIKEGPKQRRAPTEDELRSRIGFPTTVNVGDLAVGVGGYHTAVEVPLASHSNDEIEIEATVSGAPDVHVLSEQPLFLKPASTGALQLDVNPKSARSGLIDGRLNLVATWRELDDVGQPDRLRASIPIKGTVREDFSDRIPGQTKQESPAPTRQPEREPTPAAEQGMDDVMSRSEMPTQLPNGSRPVTPEDHRGSVIHAIQGSFGSFFGTITEAKNDAENAAGGEVPHDGDLGPLLSLLGNMAGFAVVGAASTFAYLVADKAKALGGFFTRKTGEKFVENFVKEGIKHVVGMATKSTPRSMAGIKSGFFGALTTELSQRKGLFMSGWATYEDQLKSLEIEDLERVHAQVNAVMKELGEVETRITQIFLVAWSNFLAQAKHGGGMAGWDHGERHGSIGAMQLQDAAERPADASSDPTRANVAPEKMTESMERTGPSALTKTESGMLEVFVNIDGELRSKGPRMRLADVSEEAKKKLAAIPRVGDAHLNKVVRIMDGVNVVGSLLVTADGYVRNSSGGSTAHYDARAIAEKVQNLPMSELER